MAKRSYRQRSREFAALYGVNNRRLEHSAVQIRARLQYVCEFLFGGDEYEMAGALGVCYRQFHIIMNSHSRVSIRLAAQVVSRLGVRGDWLLAGIGPPFLRAPEEPGVLTLPPVLNSSFPLYEPLDSSSGVPMLPPLGSQPADPPDTLPESYMAAAKAIFDANKQSLPVALFLGFDSPDMWDSAAAELFKERYLHFLAATLTAAKRDLRNVLATADIDMNYLARQAAAAGIGYGEAIGQWAFKPDAAASRASSVLASAYDVGVPVTLRGDIGEISDHDQAGFAGAELGAAIGAATYVDHLVFAKYFEAFWQKAGGVVIIAGEPHRWVPVVKKIADTHPADFTLILLTSVSPSPDTAVLARLGATVVDITEASPVFFSQLLRACRLVYAAGGSEGSNG